MSKTSNISPPSSAYRLLQWYCNTALLEEIEGDLYEAFLDDYERHGLKIAQRKYSWRVIQFIKPFTLKRDIHSNNFPMVKNNIIIAYRSLVKKMGYTLVNIFGLSIGLACCMMILIYVDHETSYDAFQDEDVYRIALNRKYPDREVNYTVMPHSIPPQLAEDFPYVEQQGRLIPPFGNTTVRYEDQFYDEEFFSFADSTLFDVVKFDFVMGDPTTALKDNNTVVVSESIATKYFKGDDPMGKTLETNNGNWTVTGVFRDYPQKSHFRADLIGSMQTFPFFNDPSWASFSAMAYIKLRPGTNPKTLEEAFPTFVKKYAAGQIQQMTGQTYDEYIAAGNGYIYTLQPIRDIHLHSNLEGELKSNGSISYVYIFVSVAIFIMLIACINFMNLSTARSTERAKEVGIRKVLGSLKSQLITQFLTESILLSLASFLVALILVVLAIPAFAELADRLLTLDLLTEPLAMVIMFFTVLLIGLLAGLYPAFVLSAYRPVQVLKGKMQTSKLGVVLRNGLVVFQFAISIGLIASTVIIFNQMNFMIDKELGYDKEHVLIIEGTNNLQDKAEIYRQQLIGESNITNAGFASNIPGNMFTGFSVNVQGSSKDAYVGRQMTIDENYIPSLNINVIEGRQFDNKFNDTLSIILNRTAQTVLGLDDPIGKKITNGQNNDAPFVFNIIGVVDDFHFQPLHREIEPLFITHVDGPFANQNFMMVKVKPNNIQGTLAEMERNWADLVPNSPFKASFMDRTLEEFYNTERTSGRLFTAFTSLAIVIACIGLFGLAAYTTGQKTKEIGVRKVMGASVPSIIFLLSREFTKLILISLIVAVPITWYGMNNWLDDFAYRIDISPLTFIISGFGAILIGWVTVSYQSFRAAIVNPVRSLRAE
ncbi:MAG: ABC transporter permease [Cyclobacteriaceae bacterium]